EAGKVGGRVHARFMASNLPQGQERTARARREDFGLTSPFSRLPREAEHRDEKAEQAQERHDVEGLAAQALIEPAGRIERAAHGKPACYRCIEALCGGGQDRRRISHDEVHHAEVRSAEGEPVQDLSRQEQEGIGGEGKKRPANQAPKPAQYQKSTWAQLVGQARSRREEDNLRQDTKGPEGTDKAFAEAGGPPV